MNEDLNNIRLPRTKESTLFEIVLAIIIIIEGVFIYLKSAGDSGTLTIAAIPLLAAVVLMVTAYRPKWINMPVTIKNYRQMELKAQSARVIALVVALFPAFFTNPEWMKGPSGTIIGIGFAAIVMVIVIYYVWRIEKAQ
jgi:drug/metabolite transporter (DMT)-like permease